MTKIQVKNEDVRVALLEQAMEQNKNDHREIKDLICELKEDIKGLDNKYAPKWVATFIYALIAGGALYILQAILKNLGV